MLAAASFKPHGVGVAVDHLDNESRELEAPRAPPQHTMKLLDLDNVRSLMIRNLDVSRKDPPTLNDDHVLPHVPETDGDPHYGTHGVADRSDVNRLLALDIEELVRHTYRVQRERRTAAYVRVVSSGMRIGLLTAAPAANIVVLGNEFPLQSFPHRRAH